MTKVIKIVTIVSCFLLSIHANAEKLDLETAIKKLINYYPTLKIAQLKMQQANLEIDSVKSQLSWDLNGSVGVSHDVSAFSTPYDRFEAAANISRKLESGHSMGVSGRYQYSDDSFVLNNSFPNPSESLNLDLNYRVPLGRGEGNNGYQQSLAIAEMQKNIEALNKKEILKALTQQVVNLFYDIDNTEQRLIYTESSIKRSKRLRNYISRNMELGIYEEKDILESEAQMLKVIAEKENLILALDGQKHVLRKLLGINIGVPINLIDTAVSSSNGTEDELLMLAENDSPILQIKKYLLDISDAKIISGMDVNSAQKDIVFSVGARSLYGDSSSGNVSEEDYSAQLRFEYNYDLGNKSYTSKIGKIKKEKNIAIEDLRLSKNEVKYTLNSLLDKINRQKIVKGRLRQHKEISQKKYNEAMRRYKKGRIDTTDLIRFENDLHIVSLDYVSSDINLSHSQVNLALLTGNLWASLGMRDIVDNIGKAQ